MRVKLRNHYGNDNTITHEGVTRIERKDYGGVQVWFSEPYVYEGDDVKHHLYHDTTEIIEVEPEAGDE